MKEIGHGSSPGKVSFPRTTFMKEIGHGSSPGKVLPHDYFYEGFLYTSRAARGGAGSFKR